MRRNFQSNISADVSISRQSQYGKGFTLILTVSLLVLLMVIAVGMLSLSSVTLRTSAYQLAMAEARSNARLSMQMAVAQLQSLAGQDTRVTAPSMAHAETPVTGVWRSWEGSDHDTSNSGANGKPKAPEYDQKNQVGDPSAVPGTAEAKPRFLGWLTSSAAFAEATEPTEPVAGVTNEATSGFIPMVDNGSVVKDDARRVHVSPTMLDGNRGAIAWWTSGDNLKARVNTDRREKPKSTVAWHKQLRSNGVADPDFFGLVDLKNQPLGGGIPSTASLKMVNEGAEIHKFHDLTAFSRGLLTNTATGGWRRDLSVFSEISKWNLSSGSDYPETNMPLFTLEPGKVQTYSKAQTATHADNALIYPWAKYRSNKDASGWAQVPPICSWTALTDYMLQYQSLSSSSAAKTEMPSFVYSHGGSTNRFNFQDKVRRSPQIARIHWVYSLCSSEVPQSNPKTYKAALLITPVLSLWNPYNVEISVNDFGVNIQETAPLRFKFKVGEVVYPETNLSEITGSGTAYQRFKLNIPGETRLAAGASRVFSLSDNIPKDLTTGFSDVRLTPGYKPNGGYLFYGLNQGTAITNVPAGTKFGIDSISYDGQTIEGLGSQNEKSGIGILYDIWVNGGTKSAHRMIYDKKELGGDMVFDKLYPPITNQISAKIDEVEGIKNMPFASALFGYRMASAMPKDPRFKHLYSKGMLQANPLCYYTEIGFGDDNAAVTSMSGTGVYHPINAPYDFAFIEMNGWNDTLAAPQFESSSNSSYIVSGLTAGDGLTRCIMAELPTRPLQSLAELQHFDARNNNPIPPFQFNLIGNGSANPIFAPDQLSVTTGYNNGMCNDDGYMLNHMLFDDWFVSSIAPDVQDFSKTIKRPISTVYKDHLTNTTPLPNRYYIPTTDAIMVNGEPNVDAAVTQITAKTPDSKTGMYGYETVASKLEVEGMFNVNSISVEAWKALLRQGRNAQVPYLAANGATKLAGETSYPYPRTSIAGDQAANSGSGESNFSNPAAAEFAGYRTLTDEQIDALAEVIVNEIKLRGPFLSLSEFVNRQVSTNKDLAIAATIQKALDQLALMGSSSKNPFQNMQALSQQITEQPAGVTDYKFPEAALGWSAFGMPGWTRQADILRPLAPVLSARDDTFTIRAYGDARDPSNASKILAKAWCEVTVQRKANYVDATEAAEIAPFSAKMKSNLNKRFGRRFEIVSFRWLNESEI